MDDSESAEDCGWVSHGQSTGLQPQTLGCTDAVLTDGHLPVENNHIENQIWPIAIGRNNWLLAGSLCAGKRGTAVVSLIQSARLNVHDPHSYLKDLITRLPTQRNNMIGDLLSHR